MAKNNATSATPKGTSPKLTEENTPRHKLMAMGQTVKTGAEGGKKTPA